MTQFIELKRTRLPNGLECYTPPPPRELWLGQTKQDWQAMGWFLVLLALLALINRMWG